MHGYVTSLNVLIDSEDWFKTIIDGKRWSDTVNGSEGWFDKVNDVESWFDIENDGGLSDAVISGESWLLTVTTWHTYVYT